MSVEELETELNRLNKEIPALLARKNEIVEALKTWHTRVTALIASFEPEDILSKKCMPIEDLKFSSKHMRTRIINCLKGENIVTIEDLLKLSEIYLQKIPDFGRRSLNELKSVLETEGLSLKKFTPEKTPTF